MNITREQLDALNAVVKIDIKKEDYESQVNTILNDYRKTAAVPGFRKGRVPMGLIKKQYREAVLSDEINKLIQEGLRKHIAEEKLDILGAPIPRPLPEEHWEAEQFSFEFELGLAPEFEVDLKPETPFTQYKVVADEEAVEGQIKELQAHYATLHSQEIVTTESEITGHFKNEFKNIDNETTFSLGEIKEEGREKFIEAKVGDHITLDTKAIYDDLDKIAAILGVKDDLVEDLEDIEVSFEIKEINQRIPAELNQELFDKVFEKDQITSVEALKEEIKKGIESQYVQRTNQKLLDDITTYLIHHTTFDLPEAFLEKWIQSSSEAKTSYADSENSIRYQLIEDKICKTYDLKVTPEDLKKQAKSMVAMQMAQFGQMNPEEQVLEDITNRILSNQEESERLANQVISGQILEVYKTHANITVKDISLNDFTALLQTETED